MRKKADKTSEEKSNFSTQDDEIEKQPITDEALAEGELSDTAKPKKEKRFLSFFGDLLFYTFLIVFVIAVGMWSSNGMPKVFFGYSAFTVLTGSMENEIPRGSLIITKQVDPESLKIGDDISYLVSEKTIITHRIVGIEEDYLESGQLGFQTQGTMNKEPDELIVPAVNIVGKVVYHNHTAGKLISFLKANWPLVIFIPLVIIVLIKVLKEIYKS